jgi:vacuole morphology and inheritance protein 14
VATENLLADFLREIRDVSVVRRRHEEQAKASRVADLMSVKEKLPDIALSSERAAFIPENDSDSFQDGDSLLKDDHGSEAEHRDAGGMNWLLLWMSIS